MAGIGATVVTAEKVETMMNELVSKGKLSTEEATKAMDQMFADSKVEYEHSRAQAESFFQEMIKRCSLATQHDLAALEKRIAALEGQAVQAAHATPEPVVPPAEPTPAATDPAI